VRNAEQLSQNAPSPRRALAEVGLVLATVFVPGNLSAFGLVPLVAVTSLLAAWGLLILRPWAQWQASQRGQAVACVLLFGLALGGATAPVWLGGTHAPPPRLGVQHTHVALGGEGPAARQAVELTRIEPGLPADGHLRVGDRILAVDGQALSATEPELDFQTRVREAGDGDSTDIHFTVERQGETREETVHVGPTRNAQPFEPGSMTWLCLRALGMSLLVALMVWRDGQGPAQLGLVREGLGRELLLGIPATVGAYAVQLAAAIPLVLLATLLKLTAKETAARTEVATALAGTGLSLPVFAAAMVLVTGFEELAFRGFLVPRLRVLVGRWSVAVVLSAVLFGMGHFYEGTLAVAQTALLGIYFGFVFLYRGRLPSVMVAHAAFNTLNFAFMLWLQRSGLLEKLSQQVPHP
jgi:membrane protease YdiL (CAAX protease family)